MLEASSADEAIPMLRNNPDIGIVMTDVEMPGSLNGVRRPHRPNGLAIYSSHSRSRARLSQ